ncbi:MAG: hypothetical protein IPN71_09195 [Fibrobacteres bacterium]|nr:hypothetical protein [Fibrobacterota bacterium]
MHPVLLPLSWRWSVSYCVLSLLSALAGGAHAAKALELHSAHYTIWSSAPAPRAQMALQATESLHQRWQAWVGGHTKHDTSRHQLMLYGSRTEMRQALPGIGWAEAFYNGKQCVQYDDPSASRPLHWLVHEATHQLVAEDAHLTLPRWANEGLACLFSVSRMVPGPQNRLEIRLATVDPNTYPTWWLPRFKLSGVMSTDLNEEKIILPTTILKEPESVDISNSLNQHYLSWWSMASFFHAADSQAWKKWIITDGTDEGLMRRFGPRKTLDDRWYAHLMRLSDSANAKQ